MFFIFLLTWLTLVRLSKCCSTSLDESVASRPSPENIPLTLCMYSAGPVNKHSCSFSVLFVLSQASPEVQQPDPHLHTRFPQRLQPRGRRVSVHKVSECNSKLIKMENYVLASYVI